MSAGFSLSLTLCFCQLFPDLFSKYIVVHKIYYEYNEINKLLSSNTCWPPVTNIWRWINERSHTGQGQRCSDPLMSKCIRVLQLLVHEACWMSHCLLHVFRLHWSWLAYGNMGLGLVFLFISIMWIGYLNLAFQNIALSCCRQQPVSASWYQSQPAGTTLV